MRWWGRSPPKGLGFHAWIDASDFLTRRKQSNKPLARKQEMCSMAFMRARKPPSYRFDPTPLADIFTSLGVVSDAQRARLLGVDASNYHRAARGETTPSGLFIHRVMTTVTRRGWDVAFHDLFPADKQMRVAA